MSVLEFKPIPSQVVNIGGVLRPLDLNYFLESKERGVKLHFQGELSNGDALPPGIICTDNGIVSGLPKEGTQGHYDVVIHVKKANEPAIQVTFKLLIRERPAIETIDLNNLKSRVWEALGKDLPLPEIADIINRPVTAVEIYYLLQRFATLTIWDVYNLESPGEKNLLTLEGSSPHYNIYDRGSCLVGTPKDLFSHERTLEDALQTARVMGREIHRRGWVVEFAGFDKMSRACWVELEMLGEQTNKKIEVLHFTPTEEDLKIFSARINSPAFKK